MGLLSKWRHRHDHDHNDHDHDKKHPSDSQPSSSSAMSSPPPPPAYTPTPTEAWRSAIPDTALFPPPPPFFSTWDRSPASNATAEQDRAGHVWCRSHPLLRASTQPQAAGPRPEDMQLLPPVGFGGLLDGAIGPGAFSVSVRDAPDHTLLGFPPLFTPGSETSWIYYEVKILPSSPKREIGLAMGFAALPYPPFRLPGWHRGSLAVHGDDGHRYVNDDAGGVGFVRPFQRGRTYGIGMEFSYGKAKAVFTCEGEVVGGWELDEGRDRETFGEGDEGIVGLEGENELCAAIGAFGTVAYEAVFDPARWLYRR